MSKADAAIQTVGYITLGTPTDNTDHVNCVRLAKRNDGRLLWGLDDLYFAMIAGTRKTTVKMYFKHERLKGISRAADWLSFDDEDVEYLEQELCMCNEVDGPPSCSTFKFFPPRQEKHPAHPSVHPTARPSVHVSVRHVRPPARPSVRPPNFEHNWGYTCGGNC